jgi:hypothetical protein
MVVDPFEKLYTQLQLESWPLVYLFKFIVPNNEKTIAEVIALFENQNEIAYRNSQNGNFVSITIKELMLNPESVIEIYRKSAEIKGVISL